MTAAVQGLTGRIDRLARLRTEANAAFFATESERIAGCCHRMAERFVRGGRLVALGHSAAARSDARHVAVEFVHPVIVGKRALPALGLAAEGGPLTAQVDAVVEADDIAIAFGAEEADGSETVAALAAARARGALTIAFADGGRGVGVHPRRPTTRSCARSWSRPCTTCSGSWSTCSSTTAGLLAGRERSAGHDAGASSFLYPFLAESETDLDAVTEDVRRSALMKSAEVGELREQTLGENARGAGRGRRSTCASASTPAGACSPAATAVRRPTRWTWLPTSAPPPQGGRRARAIDLTATPRSSPRSPTTSASARIFQRQVIAYGREGDALARALDQRQLREPDRGPGRGAARAGSRRSRWSATTAAGSPPRGSPTTSIVTRSQNIPRIQEAQASAYHVLRELIERGPADGGPPHGAERPRRSGCASARRGSSRGSAFAHTSTGSPPSSASAASSSTTAAASWSRSRGARPTSRRSRAGSPTRRRRPRRSSG